MSRSKPRLFILLPRPHPPPPAAWGRAAAFRSTPTVLSAPHNTLPHSHPHPFLTPQTYVFGYEFPDTISVLADHTLYVFTTEKKLSHLQAAAAASTSGPTRLSLVLREKGADPAAPGIVAAQAKLIDATVAAARGKLGTFPADALEGAAGAAWTAAVGAAGLERVDASRGLEVFFSTMDGAAVEDAKKAGALAARVMRDVMQKEFENLVDEGRDSTNRGFADFVTEAISSRAALEKRKVPVDNDNFTEVLPVSVQSGGEEALGVMVPGGPVPTDKPLSQDVVLMGLTMRYKNVRAGVARTFMINPTPKMQGIYDIVYRTHGTLIAGLKAGATVGAAVTAARDALTAEPNLPVDGVTLHKNFGMGMGVRIADKSLVLNTKNATVIAPGMTFCVTTGLRGVPMADKHESEDAAVNKLNTYGVLLGDTVLVTPEGPVVITDKAPRARTKVSYETVGEDEEGDEGEEAAGGDADAAAAKRKMEKRAAAAAAAEGGGRDGTGRSARLREKQKEVDPEASSRRAEAQLLLMKRRGEAAQKKKGGGGGGEEDGGDMEGDAAAEVVAYASPIEYPPRVKLNQIMVDKSREAVLVPWQGTMVPISLLAIKSVVQQNEGDKHFLRFNLYAPGSALGKDVAPAMAGAIARAPDAVFVKTLNFMSRDGRNFVAVEALVKSMLKRLRDQRKEEKEAAGVVEQPRLQMIKHATTPAIHDVSMWPPISGRKTQGTVSVQANGLLFRSNKNETCEIIFGNIKYGIYQPCEQEHVVLLHFHLRHPILLGKKKQRDIQFFTELVESSEMLDARGRNDYDPDEMGAEANERAMREKVNKSFFKFAKRVEEAAMADPGNRGFTQMDVPVKGVQFTGAPMIQKEMTTVRISANALFAVVDKPPMVVGADDMELVHFERVVYGGKSFDMVCVYKEGVVEKGTPEFVRITGIEMKCVGDGRPPPAPGPPPPPDAPSLSRLPTHHALFPPATQAPRGHQNVAQ
jgi:nucleosome binding factor SPN SPT16 subunit